MDEIARGVSGVGDALRALGAELSSIWLYLQLGAIVAIGALSLGIAALIRRRIDLVSLTMGWPAWMRQFARALVANLAPLVFVIMASIVHAIMADITWPSRSYLIGVAVKLASAWVAINLLAGLIRNRFIFRIVAVSAWTVAALSILGVLGTVAAALDSVAVVVGGLRLSPLLLIETTALLLVTLWFAAAVSAFLEKRLHSVADLTPSIQVLIGKLIRIILITFAIVVVLSSVGIDFSAVAWFSGAVGVGVGFGLQKIVSNLFSGIILLADKSIKPGDVISVGDSFGWVSTMGARYTSVVTRDGREFLIPNEDFVTQRVVNWSYTNDEVRLDVNFGVGYGSDPHKVRELAVAAAKSIPRVLTEKEPVCHLVAFGDSSLDFVLRFWIKDPVDGITNVRGAVLLALWDAFKREGIEIPFPQRDLNPRGPFHVVVEGGVPQR